MVINAITEPLLQKWSEKKYGPHLDLKDMFSYVYVPLFNFADDFVIFARNPGQLQIMLDDLNCALKVAGLCLDVTKTEWSHNLAMIFSETEAMIADMKTVKEALNNDYRRMQKEHNKLICDRREILKKSKPATCPLSAAELGAINDELARLRQARLAVCHLLADQCDTVELLDPLRARVGVGAGL